MNVRDQFQERFGQAPVQVNAPGRINLIGEHTDYNDGFVLPAAIDRRIEMAVGPNGKAAHCRLYAADLGESLEIDFDDIQPQSKPGWANYILGVVAELRASGARLEGFDCLFAGNIPIGGGLSSSAALENATAVGLNQLFDLGLSKEKLLHLSQRAEHRYAGVQCGIMDQFATMMGKAGHALLLDCRTLDYEYVPLDLKDHVLVLCDTNVSHSLAASEYNTRRRECEEAVRLLQPAFPNMRALRDLTTVGLKAERNRISELLFRRAHHVITENERVQLAVAALRAGELSRLGDLLYQSHNSLQNDYEVSCTELDFLVDFTRSRDEVLGARMMGGGFGGSTLNLVEKDKAEYFLKDIGEAYQKEMDREMGRYVVRVGAGAGMVT